MDYKITNFDVTTENARLKQTAELPIDADITLADYEPDIKRILKCEIKPYINSKRITGNALGIEGTAIVTVIYCDSNSLVFSSEAEVPFKKLFESEAILDGGNCEVYITASAHTCRAVTERKLSVHGAVKIDAVVYTFQKKQIISDIDSNCFEMLTGETEATTPMGNVDKSFVIDEELVLGEGMPSASKIIQYAAVPVISEHKIINNKIIVKGTLKVTAFYCTLQGEACNYKTDIPFNQIVDLVGIGEDCECDTKVSVSSLNISTRTSQNGECKSFMLVCKLLITASARCESNIPVIFDIYSTRFEMKAKKEDVCFNKMVHQSSEGFNCKKTLPFPEGSFNRIINLWCHSSNCMPRFDDSGMQFSGTITVCIIAADENNEPTYFERIIDYDYPIEIAANLKRPICRPTSEILNTEYCLTPAGDIELSLELLLGATVYDISNVSLITEIEVFEDKEVNSNCATIIAYYADKGESIWEISKFFLADRKELMTMNEIKEDKVTSPTMLLIPRF